MAGDNQVHLGCRVDSRYLRFGARVREPFGESFGNSFNPTRVWGQDGWRAEGSGQSPAESPGPIPTPLQKWLDDREATSARPSVALIPGGKKTREFVLVTVPLRNLEFKNNDYNPREPNEGKVNELAASISTLSLLSPLTCAYIDDAAAATAAELSQEGQADRKPNPRDSKSESEKKDEDESDGEPVVIIDGRHR